LIAIKNLLRLKHFLSDSLRIGTSIVLL